MKKKVHLTRPKAKLVAWACYAALDQYRKHLMHDGWQLNCAPVVKRETLRTERRLQRALLTIREAIGPDERYSLAHKINLIRLQKKRSKARRSK